MFVYPEDVQCVFEKYYEKIRSTLNWAMVLPLFFKKNELKKSNSLAWYAKCPFHHEITASMRFSNQYQSFLCFGCGHGGSIFKFISYQEGGNINAMFFIKRHFGIPLPFAKKEWKKIQKRLEKQWEIEEFQRVNGEFQIAAYQSLHAKHETFWENDEDTFVLKANQLLDEVLSDQLSLPTASDIDEYEALKEKERRKVEEAKLSAELRKKWIGKMQQFIIVRHGFYDLQGRLSDFGKRQMEALARQVADVCFGKQVVFLSSSAPRALDSSEVISEITGISFEKHDLLWSDDRHCENYDGVMELIAEKATMAEVVIVLSHLEYCNYLPYLIAKKLEIENDVNLYNLEKGQACVCDFSMKKFVHLQNKLG